MIQRVRYRTLLKIGIGLFDIIILIIEDYLDFKIFFLIPQLFALNFDAKVHFVLFS